MELELKHIAPYLPYGLKMYWEDFENNPRLPWELKGHNIDFAIENQNKPILRPLSDLTKEIEVNGEKFVPIEILSEELEGITFGKTSDFYDNLKRLMFHFYDRHEVEINIEDCLFLISKLYEWHFDIFGLIENKLAININTL